MMSDTFINNLSLSVVNINTFTLRRMIASAYYAGAAWWLLVITLLLNMSLTADILVLINNKPEKIQAGAKKYQNLLLRCKTFPFLELLQLFVTVQL